MSICVLQNLEKDRVLWTNFLASCREINRFSVSKIGPEQAKPMISLALIGTPKNIKFSICSKWKIHYFQVSQNLGRVQSHLNVLEYWDT